MPKRKLRRSVRSKKKAVSTYNKALKGPGSRIFFFGPDGGKVHIGGSRNKRNNNLGNMEFGRFTKKRGAIGTDGRFAIFPDTKTGNSVHKKLLQGKKNLSIRQLMRSYAPPSENDTKSYVKYLSGKIGKPASSKLKDLTPAQFDELVKGIRRYEGTKPPKTIHFPKSMGGYIKRLASGTTSTKPWKQSAASKKAMFKRASRSTTSGYRSGSLRREGNKVYRIEPDGSYRGSFVSE